MVCHWFRNYLLWYVSPFNCLQINKQKNNAFWVANKSTATRKIIGKVGMCMFQVAAKSWGEKHGLHSCFGKCRPLSEKKNKKEREIASHFTMTYYIVWPVVQISSNKTPTTNRSGDGIKTSRDGQQGRMSILQRRYSGLYFYSDHDLFKFRKNFCAVRIKLFIWYC